MNVQALLYVIRILLAGSVSILCLQGLVICTHAAIFCARSVCGAEISQRKLLAERAAEYCCLPDVDFLRHDMPVFPLGSYVVHVVFVLAK